MDWLVQRENSDGRKHKICYLHFSLVAYLASWGSLEYCSALGIRHGIKVKHVSGQLMEVSVSVYFQE